VTVLFAPFLDLFAPMLPPLALSQHPSAD